MDEVVTEFLIESYENLDRLDRDLVALEKDPAAKETLASVFRTIHTLKGSSGFLGYQRLEAVAHVAENLLSKLRDGQIVFNADLTSALLATMDAVRYMLGQIEAVGHPGEQDFSSLIERLTRLHSTGEARPSAASAAAPVPSTPEPAAPPAEPEAAGAERAERGSAASDSSIRVDVGLLDKLMNLVGELVLARNQVLQFAGSREDGAFLATSQRLNLITTELQGSVMKTRMQPIEHVWRRLPRVVRDLAQSCGKQVRLEMVGQGTELDKTIIEAIKDPLTHLVRNAVDHGIERPQLRAERGKPPEGCLKMRAYHEGGQVNLEISDDGGGVDCARVKQLALQRGLIAPDQAARMSDHEACQLIFLPGFSTAEKVTTVSGRGVGMDVVRANIEKIGGTVDLQSQPGVGTSLKIKIPLTLAIIPALIVSSGGERFAIPQVNLQELLRLESDRATQQIEFIHGNPVFRLRGKLLPLANLNRELKIGGERTDGQAVNIVVLQADGHSFGLVVDEIKDTEEIVVKPLSKQLKNVAWFAGATIMGDGRVALILDVVGVAQGARLLSGARDRAAVESQAVHARPPLDQRQTLLLFEAGPGSRMAIPLSLVARLEEFSASAVEHSGPQEVVRYRGQILPLVRVERHVAGFAASSGDPETLQVVVYTEADRSVGLVVGRIHDIVHDALAVKRHAPAHGIFGSVVIQDRVTDLLDVQAIVRAADSAFFPALAAVPAAA